LDIAAKAQRMYLPIEGDEIIPVVSLERAVDTLVDLLPNIHEKVKQAKLNCENPLDGLSCDESASIYLYSMRWEPHDECLCFVLNSALHGNNQETLKPWNRYLRLLFTALDRLPSIPITFIKKWNLILLKIIQKKMFLSVGNLRHAHYLLLSPNRNNRLIRREKEQSLKCNVIVRNILKDILPSNHAMKLFFHQHNFNLKDISIEKMILILFNLEKSIPHFLSFN